MKLYNTLTRKIEALRPQAPPQVTIYTCGPTVYDYPHVGNWFTYVREDILVRTLKISGLRPKWVMNITDVGHLTSDADEGEDKLEKGAHREGKTAWDVARFYTAYFVDGMQRLNMLKPDVLPLATEHIADQVALIKQLEAKGYTYTVSDGVYYDTSKFAAYADFAQLDTDEQQAGARVKFNPEKRHPTDFALWKFSPTDRQRDMEWDSPWGKGFPGWHIECSAMSMKYLGETLDIHAGGIDHVPVHHTNEIAQSEAATGKTFARSWFHGNHITIEGDKISKSLGNGITLEAIEGRSISLEAFRLYVLESHYRSQSKFSWEGLEAAQRRLLTYQAMADQRWQPSESGSLTATDFAKTKQSVSAALQNDLGTPQALAALSQLEVAIDNGGISTHDQAAYIELLQWLDEALGLQLSRRQDISSQIKSLIGEREAARLREDWAQSDSLRDRLLAARVIVKDTSRGPIWQRA